jgi:hypothetical protein
MKLHGFDIYPCRIGTANGDLAILDLQSDRVPEGRYPDYFYRRPWQQSNFAQPVGNTVAPANTSTATGL